MAGREWVLMALIITVRIRTARSGGSYYFVRNGYHDDMDEEHLEARVHGLLADAERLTGLTITVHDRGRVFAGELGLKNGHAHWYCALQRNLPAIHGHRCMAHCQRAINARAQEPGCVPFVHSCWKGCSEAVAPVQRGGGHVLTVFGGSTRAGSEPPAGLASEIARAWRRLPEPDPQRMTAAGSVLTALGHGLLALLDAQPVHQDSRRGRIDRLIESRMHEDLGPEVVGLELGLSPSRAAHVVAEIYGKALGDLLRERRLARAKRLLAVGDEAVGVIARRCGFISQHWFNRLFARSVGMPPARWRRAQRAGA
jgi:AraC-like DNA-binding protein